MSERGSGAADPVVGDPPRGRNRPEAWWLGDPPRMMVTRYLRWFVAADARVRYVSLYGIHKAGGKAHDGFLDRVSRVLAGC